MENIGQDFAFDYPGARATLSQEARCFFDRLTRLTRRSFATLRDGAASLKTTWDAASLRAAHIDHQIQNMKQEQALFFGRHRIF